MLNPQETVDHSISAYLIADGITLNVHQNTLTNNGAVIELENRLVSLLIYFIRHPQQVLRKELLLKTIWQGKVVNDDSLAVAVSHLRKALGDNSRAPRFIKTIPGIGYQFIALAEPVDTKAQAALASSTTPKRGLMGAALLTACALLVLVLAYLYRQPTPAPTPVSPAQAPDWQKTYLAGMHLLNTDNPDDWRQAISVFRSLINTQGDSAELYLGIADAKTKLLAEKISIRENCIELVGLLEKAVALNPGLAPAHRSLANLTFWCQRDYARAEQHYLQAISLNPKDDAVLIFYAQLLLAQHRFDESLTQVERARQLNPLNYSAPDIVWIMQMQGRDDLALRELDRILTTETDNRYHHISALRIYYRMGDNLNAFAQWQWLMRESRFSETDMTEVAQAFAQGGLKAVNAWLLTHKIAADLGEYTPPLSWARYALAAGQFDLALNYLEDAYKLRQSPLLWASVDPAYAPVRTAPRFQKILAQLKQPEHK